MNAQKVWSCNKFKMMKCLCNRWVFIRNLDTSKESVQLVHEVHPVFAVTFSTFLHMPCGWNDDTMPSFNLLEFICSAFQFQGHLARNKSVNASKTSNYVRKGWKLTTWLWVVHNERKKSGVVISLKKWSAHATDEFSSETLILRKRLSSLYTKCVQFLP